MFGYIFIVIWAQDPCLVTVPFPVYVFPLMYGTWYLPKASAIISNSQPAEKGKVTCLSDMRPRCCVPVGHPIPEPGRI